MSVWSYQVHPTKKMRAFLRAIVAGLVCSPLGTAFAQSGDPIPRSLLIDMANDQYSVLCSSETFTACMGFSTKICKELADSAIEQCLLPLPETIDPEALNNSSLESCPVGVFEDAGFSEKKAGMCYDEAVEAEGSE